MIQINVYFKEGMWYYCLNYWKIYIIHVFVKLHQIQSLLYTVQTLDRSTYFILTRFLYCIISRRIRKCSRLVYCWLWVLSLLVAVAIHMGLRLCGILTNVSVTRSILLRIAAADCWRLCHNSECPCSSLGELLYQMFCCRWPLSKCGAGVGRGYGFCCPKGKLMQEKIISLNNRVIVWPGSIVKVD